VRSSPLERQTDFAALYTVLRKGELPSFCKADVDLEDRLLTVSHSYRRDTTKGGRADVIPIATELAPYLEDASSRWARSAARPTLVPENTLTVLGGCVHRRDNHWACG